MTLELELEQLRATFERHESLAPDADVVRAKAQQIARHLQRQRWAVRATGTAMLGAGLVAGGLSLPDLVHGSPGNKAVLSPAAGGGGTAVQATPKASTGTTSTTDEDLRAYFNAGYDYNDAQQLARLWHETGDIGAVKAEAGGKLLAGQTLPIPPSGTPASPQDLALQAYFDAGYDYNDAVALAKVWHETDISQVKVEAGQKLQNGETLPVPPTGSSATKAGSAAAKATPEEAVAPASQKALNAFFAAGYTYDDATQLARIWHETDITQVKAEAGKKLLAGETLPIAR